MLQALVHNQTPDPDKPAFDDFIEGKGKGLIVLLQYAASSNDGTFTYYTTAGHLELGKRLPLKPFQSTKNDHFSEFVIPTNSTRTASFADFQQVCAGDLGLDSEKLEDRLAEILDLVARWKAILLLDEADVFLEARTQHHLQHNTLVSVFLRQLEYFQGVMILTTNRVTVFDEAVQSRIHLGIKYDQLSKKAKAEIWTAFIQQANKVSTTGIGAPLSPKQLDDLSRKEFNGRQVRKSAYHQFKDSSLITESRSRTPSAWPTLSRQPRAYRLDTTTLWRPLKRTKTLTMTSEEQGRLRARRRIFRDFQLVWHHLTHCVAGNRSGLLSHWYQVNTLESSVCV